MLSKITPKLRLSQKVKTGEELYLTGYPPESNGCMFQLKGKVFDKINVDNETTTLYVLKDLKSTGGMNGSPILKLNEDSTELMGKCLRIV
jgi:V8-like Glu-specific endopeptidase